MEQKVKAKWSASNDEIFMTPGSEGACPSITPDGDNSNPSTPGVSNAGSSSPSIPSVELVGQGDQRVKDNKKGADPTPCMPGA